MSRYFSNSTEGDAWTARWCEACVHDHDMTHEGATLTEGCDLMLLALVDEPVAEWRRRQEPPFMLPADMVCDRFEPCHLGTCEGDPWPDIRDAVRERVAAEPYIEDQENTP